MVTCGGIPPEKNFFARCRNMENDHGPNPFWRFGPWSFLWLIMSVSDWAVIICKEFPQMGDFFLVGMHPSPLPKGEGAGAPAVRVGIGDRDRGHPPRALGNDLIVQRLHHRCRNWSVFLHPLCRTATLQIRELGSGDTSLFWMKKQEIYSKLLYCLGGTIEPSSIAQRGCKMIPGIAKILIEGEISASRFEEFAVEISARVLGINLVGTSTNYDRARDGRSLTSQRRGKGQEYGAVLHATLRADLDKKVKSDISTMAEHTGAKHVIYCSSQPVTEQGIDKLSAEIRAICPNVDSVTVFGSFQLSQFSEYRHPGVFENFYAGEIATIEQRLNPNRVEDETAEKRGLRLALVAFGNEDSAALRDSLLQRVVLELLSKHGELLQREMLDVISKDLGLNSCLPAGILTEAIATLRASGLVAGDPRLSITESGKEKTQEAQVEATRDLFEGRALIKNSLESLSGLKIHDTQFQQIWNVLLDFLSDLFYTKGHQVICAVNAVFKGKSAVQKLGPVSLDSLLERGANSIAATYRDVQAAGLMKQAVLDMFNEHTGPVFDWLAAVCERFVSLCALGLEASSSDELKHVLRNYQIVLDSDIVLTLLCTGEPEHDAAKSLINAWRRMGGSVRVARPVLEEAAHHAWISDMDFNQTKHLLGRLSTTGRLRYIQNAFVRTFHSVERDAKKWTTYINFFKGRSPEDFSKILRALRANFGVDILEEAQDGETKRQMTKFFLDSFATSKGVPASLLNSVEVGKAERDGRLMAAISEARTKLGSIGSQEVVVLISSSPRMKKANARFRTMLGDPDAVLSLGAASYLLSLVPEAGLGLASLRHALFEFGENAKLSDDQRIALRIIKGQDEYDLPWAARGMLQQQLSDAISKEARRRGVPPDKVRKRITDPAEGDELPAQLILGAVRAMAIEGSTMAELTKAKHRIEELEQEIDDLKVRKTPLRKAR
jgi:hypothetical protein